MITVFRVVLRSHRSHTFKHLKIPQTPQKSINDDINLLAPQSNVVALYLFPTRKINHPDIIRNDDPDRSQKAVMTGCGRFRPMILDIPKTFIVSVAKFIIFKIKIKNINFVG